MIVLYKSAKRETERRLNCVATDGDQNATITVQNDECVTFL